MLEAQRAQALTIGVPGASAMPAIEGGSKAKMVAPEVSDAGNSQTEECALAHRHRAYAPRPVPASVSTLLAMIDSHAHLALFSPAEREEVLARAREAGVDGVLVPATGLDDLELVAEMAHIWPSRVWIALGFHPHEARHLDAAGKRRLEGLLHAPGPVAIGEIGLDYHYDYSPRDEQRRAFAWQLALARELGLPVILHHREAWADFLATLDAVAGLQGVAHSFTEGAGGVQEMVARGLLVGISGMVTFPRAENIREAAAATPRGGLLVETDSPYLAPAPHRGKRNEPAYVRLIAEEAAKVRGVALGELERETDAAFAALFLRRLPPISPGKR
jgi:TatD DNase family protein